MSEKQFTLNMMRKPSEIEMDGKMISKYEVVRLLNEQQSTITALKEENMKLRNGNERLKKNFDMMEDDLTEQKTNLIFHFRDDKSKLKEKIKKLAEENEELKNKLNEKQEQIDLLEKNREILNNWIDEYVDKFTEVWRIVEPCRRV